MPDEDKIKTDHNSLIGNTSVFLAWSGEVSKKMAGLLKEYLPLFVRNIAIFMSEDITKGKRWHTEIANALGSTKFGILCLTPENLTSEWIHFEAGALSKTIDDSTHVCPLLLDIKKSELKEPLASFHATIFDKEEFKKLIKALAKACGDSLEETQFTTLMEALWPKIDDYIKTFKDELIESRKESGKPEDSESKVDPLLEEVIVRVREQGRLLAAFTEQSGISLGKDIIDALHYIKLNQKEQRRIMNNLLKIYKRQQFFREKEEIDNIELLEDPMDEDSSIRDIELSNRMKELDNILPALPSNYLSNPEATLDAMIRAGFLHERMIELFGGRSGIIDAIRFLIKRRSLLGDK